MKRVLLTVALCIATSVAFGQKKAVSDAQSIAKGTNPDFTEARSLIKGALDNSETKDDAKTWFVAGFIEDQQFNAEKTKQILGQKPDEAKMYEAVYAVYPYFKKALDLDQVPDAKGKVKPKVTKDVKSILGADHVFLFNGGAYYFDQKNYQKAFDFFNQFLEIADMPLFAETSTAAKDSTYMTVQFYAGVASTQINNPQVAIKALERAKNTPYRQNDVYQYLCYEYEQVKDTVAMENTLTEGQKLFPGEDYFMNSLINIYIYSNRNDKAIESLNAAIAKRPDDANLYNVLGRVYETGLKDFANAEKNFKIALEKNPELIDAMSNIGRIYYNQGVAKQSEANAINDTKKYQEETAKAKDLFKQALPFFKKAHDAKPDESEYMIALRGIYYNLNMGEELKAIEAQMGNK